MVAETMNKYELASAEADYENPGERAPMGLMAQGGEIQGSENTPPWMERKRSPPTSLTGADSTNWETADVNTSGDEEAIRKATCRLNTPV